MGFGGAEQAQTGALKGAGKNAAMMRQVFQGIAEPLLTPALLQLAGRAGIVPFSILQAMQHKQPQGTPGFNPNPTAGQNNPTPGNPAAYQQPRAAAPNPGAPQAGGGMDRLGSMLQGAMEGPRQAPQPNPGVPGAGGADSGPGMGSFARMFNANTGPSAGVGQGLPGVQKGAAPPGPTGAPGYGAPPTNLPINYGGTSPLAGMAGLGQGPGWTDADRIKFGQGADTIDRTYESGMNTGLHGIDSRLGGLNNSISAGLQAKMGADRNTALAGLGRDVTLGGIQQERQSTMDLLGALGPLLGYPSQAAQTQLGVAQGYGQQAQAQNPFQMMSMLGYFA
jgi:hypothetical protein